MKAIVATAVLVCHGFSPPTGAAFVSYPSLHQLRLKTCGSIHLKPPHPLFSDDSSSSPVPRGLAAVPPGVEVIPPSYDLALGSIALAAAFGLPQSPLKTKVSAFLAGVPLLLFGLFLAYQTTALRFTFDDSNFSLVKSDLSTTGENVIVGGDNVWSYNSFVNYDYFPSRGFPILIYFKETQTPKEFWNVGPGEKANSNEALAKGAKPGQVHFFPAIGNVEAMNAAFEAHDCAKIAPKV